MRLVIPAFTTAGQSPTYVIKRPTKNMHTCSCDMSELKQEFRGPSRSFAKNFLIYASPDNSY